MVKEKKKKIDSQHFLDLLTVVCFILIKFGGRTISRIFRFNVAQLGFFSFVEHAVKRNGTTNHSNKKNVFTLSPAKFSMMRKNREMSASCSGWLFIYCVFNLTTALS